MRGIQPMKTQISLSVLLAAMTIPGMAAPLPEVAYRTQEIEGVNIFYREAGPQSGPVLVLLHGFPSSSFYYRNLISLLAGKYHGIAPDYPGFGHSDTPAVDKFEYTFEHVAGTMEKFLEARNAINCVLYMQDYGAPVGMRIAVKHPDW